MEQKANYLPRSTNIKKNKSCAIKEMTTRRMINDEINYWADKIIHVMIVWNPNHVKLNCDKGLFNLRIVEKNLIQCEKAFLCSSSSLLLAPSHSKRYRKFCNEIKTTCNRIKWGWRKKKQFRVVMWCINAKLFRNRHAVVQTEKFDESTFLERGKIPCEIIMWIVHKILTTFCRLSFPCHLL